MHISVVIKYFSALFYDPYTNKIIWNIIIKKNTCSKYVFSIYKNFII